MAAQEVILQFPVDPEHRELFEQKKTEYQQRKENRVVELNAQYQAPELQQNRDYRIAYYALSIYMMEQLETKQSLTFIPPEIDTELAALASFREALPGLFARDDWFDIMDRVIGNMKSYSNQETGMEKLKKSQKHETATE